MMTLAERSVFRKTLEVNQGNLFDVNNVVIRDVVIWQLLLCFKC